MRIADMNWLEVEAYLKQGRHDAQPFGRSVEQLKELFPG